MGGAISNAPVVPFLLQLAAAHQRLLTGDVVAEHREPAVERRTVKPDGAHDRAAHRAFDEPENMLDS